MTSCVTTGSGRPLSSIAPNAVSVTPSRPRAKMRTTSATRIWPPSASAHSRAASTTGVPKQSPSSHVTSPALIPMRTADRRSPLKSAPATACCIATAADTASCASERGDDAVARSLDDRPTVLQDELGKQSIVSAAEMIGPVLADRHPQLRRADQVRDQDRDGSRTPHRSQRTQSACQLTRQDLDLGVGSASSGRVPSRPVTVCVSLRSRLGKRG